MSQVSALLTTLKRELRSQGITYADVAAKIGLSESSVKRLFSEANLSVVRLESLCQIVGLEISDLVQKMAEERHRLEMLTEEQEQEVAEDPRLLLVAVCVLNRWTFEEIIATYTLDEHECIRHLAKLDRLKLVELLPLNRFRLTIANDFRWIPGGPIQRFFKKEVQPGFMSSSFAGRGERLIFRSGMLSRGSNATLLKKMDRLAAQFKELHDDDAGLPLEERFGSSLLVALRPWELSHFRDLRRGSQEKVF
jgi:transcriptional regulator with XRE-family HTH domain